MDGWRLAVLIVIVVVFIVVLCIYATLLYLRGVSGSQMMSVMPVFGAAAYILYFRDALSNQLYSVDTRGVNSSDDLKLRLATACGRGDASSVALSRIDEGNVLVELDLDQFLASPYLSEVLRKSATEPFVLTRHLPAHVSGASASNTPRKTQPSATATPRHVEVSAATLQLSPSRKRVLRPKPHVFPNVTLISTSTFVILSASTFVDPQTGDPIPLTDTQASNLEWAFLRETTKAADIGDGWEAVVHAKQHEALISVAGSNQPPRRIQRLSFRKIRYAFDQGLSSTSSALTWNIYEEPFRLPLGRWCIRVVAFTDDESSSDSVAKVFTVETSSQP